MKKLAFSLLFALCAIIALAADISGKWSGTFTPEGQDAQPAFLVLKQSGGSVTGSGGPSEGEQWPIENGKIAGNRVTGAAKAPDGGVYNFDLTLDGDHLKGQVTANQNGQTMKGTMDVARVK